MLRPPTSIASGRGPKRARPRTSGYDVKSRNAVFRKIVDQLALAAHDGGQVDSGLGRPYAEFARILDLAEPFGRTQERFRGHAARARCTCRRGRPVPRRRARNAPPARASSAAANPAVPARDRRTARNAPSRNDRARSRYLRCRDLTALRRNAENQRDDNRKNADSRPVQGRPVRREDRGRDRRHHDARNGLERRAGAEDRAAQVLGRCVGQQRCERCVRGR